METKFILVTRSRGDNDTVEDVMSLCSISDLNLMIAGGLRTANIIGIYSMNEAGNALDAVINKSGLDEMVSLREAVEELRYLESNRA